LQYTNQAKEFQAPLAHRGQTTTTDSGAAAAYSTNNHRSWHPVVDATGRTGTVRGNGTNIAGRWLSPFNNAVGSQTIYCSDCHGSATAAGSIQPAGGENGSPWGPHGSGNNFILKGAWNNATGSGQQATGLCFKCHDYAAYATNSGNRTGSTTRAAATFIPTTPTRSGACAATGATWRCRTAGRTRPSS